MKNQDKELSNFISTLNNMSVAFSYELQKYTFFYLHDKAKLLEPFCSTNNAKICLKLFQTDIEKFKPKEEVKLFLESQMQHNQDLDIQKFINQKPNVQEELAYYKDILFNTLYKHFIKLLKNSELIKYFDKPEELKDKFNFSIKQILLYETYKLNYIKKLRENSTLLKECIANFSDDIDYKKTIKEIEDFYSTTEENIITLMEPKGAIYNYLSLSRTFFIRLLQNIIEDNNIEPVKIYPILDSLEEHCEKHILSCLYLEELQIDLDSQTKLDLKDLNQFNKFTITTIKYLLKIKDPSLENLTNLFENSLSLKGNFFKFAEFDYGEARRLTNANKDFIISIIQQLKDKEINIKSLLLIKSYYLFYSSLALVCGLLFTSNGIHNYIKILVKFLFEFLSDCKILITLTDAQKEIEILKDVIMNLFNNSDNFEFFSSYDNPEVELKSSEESITNTNFSSLSNTVLVYINNLFYENLQAQLGLKGKITPTLPFTPNLNLTEAKELLNFYIQLIENPKQKILALPQKGSSIISHIQTAFKPFLKEKIQAKLNVDTSPVFNILKEAKESLNLEQLINIQKTLRNIKITTLTKDIQIPLFQPIIIELSEELLISFYQKITQELILLIQRNLSVKSYDTFAKPENLEDYNKLTNFYLKLIACFKQSVAENSEPNIIKQEIKTLNELLQEIEAQLLLNPDAKKLLSTAFTAKRDTYQKQLKTAQQEYIKNIANKIKAEAKMTYLPQEKSEALALIHQINQNILKIKSYSSLPDLDEIQQDLAEIQKEFEDYRIQLNQQLEILTLNDFSQSVSQLEQLLEINIWQERVQDLLNKAPELPDKLQDLLNKTPELKDKLKISNTSELTDIISVMRETEEFVKDFQKLESTKDFIPETLNFAHLSFSKNIEPLIEAYQCLSTLNLTVEKYNSSKLNILPLAFTEKLKHLKDQYIKQLQIFQSCLQTFDQSNLNQKKIEQKLYDRVGIIKKVLSLLYSLPEPIDSFLLELKLMLQVQLSYFIYNILNILINKKLELQKKMLIEKLCTAIKACAINKQQVSNQPSLIPVQSDLSQKYFQQIFELNETAIPKQLIPYIQESRYYLQTPVLNFQPVAEEASKNSVSNLALQISLETNFKLSLPAVYWTLSYLEALEVNQGKLSAELNAIRNSLTEQRRESYEYVKEKIKSLKAYFQNLPKEADHNIPQEIKELFAVMQKIIHTDEIIQMMRHLNYLPEAMHKAFPSRIEKLVLDFLKSWGKHLAQWLNTPTKTLIDAETEDQRSQAIKLLEGRLILLSAWLDCFPKNKEWEELQKLLKLIPVFDEQTFSNPETRLDWLIQLEQQLLPYRCMESWRAYLIQLIEDLIERPAFQSVRAALSQYIKDLRAYRQAQQLHQEAQAPSLKKYLLGTGVSLPNSEKQSTPPNIEEDKQEVPSATAQEETVDEETTDQGQIKQRTNMSTNSNIEEDKQEPSAAAVQEETVDEDTADQDQTKQKINEKIPYSKPQFDQRNQRFYYPKKSLTYFVPKNPGNNSETPHQYYEQRSYGQKSYDQQTIQGNQYHKGYKKYPEKETVDREYEFNSYKKSDYGRFHKERIGKNNEKGHYEYTLKEKQPSQFKI